MKSMPMNQLEELRKTGGDEYIFLTLAREKQKGP